MAERAPNLADFNPAFSSRLDAFKAALDKAGIGYSIVSGYRSPEYQGRMYANHLAKRAGQPLPYPNDEAPNVVAPAWRSFHNYGLATDFSATNPADYARIRALAPQFGLTGIGASDPGHIQLAGQLNSLIDEYKLAGWRPENQPVPAEGAIAYSGAPAAPSAGLERRAASAQPSNSARDAHIQFIRDYAIKQGVNPDLALGIANAEGLNAWSPKNPAAGSYIDRTNGAPWSFGDFQLNTRNGLGVEALKAGVDPRDPNQWQAADRFAIDRLKAQGAGAWSGDPVAKAYLATGKVAPFTAGSTLNTTGGPSGASTGAAGGPPAAPATPTPQGGLPGFQPGSPGEKMTQAGLKGLEGGGGDASEPQPMQLQPIQGGAAVGGPMMLGAGGQNVPGRSTQMVQNALAQLAALAQANSVQPMNPAAAPGLATGMPALPGTTLNSPSALQMALMTGQFSPYDAQTQGELLIMAQDLGQLTDMWMVNPTMFDPTQKSNQFSLYNNARIPFPPTYNTGLAGGPVNAATGQPIQSFQAWQAANPAGVSLNATPAQPQAPQQIGLPSLAPMDALQRQNALAGLQPSGQPYGGQGQGNFGQNALMNRQFAAFGSGYPQQQPPMAQAAPQASAAPNNWNAALNALANPGAVQTQGATVPIAQGFQPAGGVNQAFLQQAGSGQGMNQGFLSALRAIQGR